jgi:hypothetical protein
MLLIPVFGVLLFPEVQIVMAALSVVFWLTEQLGLALVTRPPWQDLLLSLAVWGVSAWLTYKFWSWVISRVRSMVRRREPRHSS